MKMKSTSIVGTGVAANEICKKIKKDIIFQRV